MSRGPSRVAGFVAPLVGESLEVICTVTKTPVRDEETGQWYRPLVLYLAAPVCPGFNRVYIAEVYCVYVVPGHSIGPASYPTP